MLCKSPLHPLGIDDDSDGFSERRVTGTIPYVGTIIGWGLDGGPGRPSQSDPTRTIDQWAG